MKHRSVQNVVCMRDPQMRHAGYQERGPGVGSMKIIHDGTAKKKWTVASFDH